MLISTVAAKVITSASTRVPFGLESSILPVPAHGCSTQMRVYATGLLMLYASNTNSLRRYFLHCCFSSEYSIVFSIVSLLAFNVGLS